MEGISSNLRASNHPMAKQQLFDVLCLSPLTSHNIPLSAAAGDAVGDAQCSALLTTQHTPAARGRHQRHTDDVVHSTSAALCSPHTRTTRRPTAPNLTRTRIHPASTCRFRHSSAAPYWYACGSQSVRPHTSQAQHIQSSHSHSAAASDGRAALSAVPAADTDRVAAAATPATATAAAE